MKSATAFSAIAVGLLMLILSGLWGSLFPGTSNWTAEKSQRLSEVRNRLHNLSFVIGTSTGGVSMHGGPELGAAKQELEQLKKEREQLAAEFQSAHDSPNTVAKILKWTGISLAALGVIGWYAVKQTS